MLTNCVLFLPTSSQFVSLTEKMNTSTDLANFVTSLCFPRKACTKGVSPCSSSESMSAPADNRT